jgi:3-oxoacyl-[acyl-carrier protein] reductase
LELEGRTVAITGASRGIGAAIATGLAHRKVDLALIDRDADTLAETARACRSLGVMARAYPTDVADEGSVVETYARIAEDFGRLDASIANAGILRDGLLVKVKEGEIVGKMSLADWQAVIDVNLTGVFLCGREAAEQMLRTGSQGSIINISSISRAGNFGQSNYSAAKAGVAALTVVWAKELARHGIRANAIAPGFVRTEILAAMRPEVLEKMSASIPVGRLGRPDEIASTVVFLLENDYVNGRVIEIDGGQRL